MYLTVFLWGLFIFFSILKFNFENLLVCGVAFTLTFSNLYGYYQCSRDAQERVKNVLTQGAVNVLSGGLGSFFSRAVAGGATAPAPTSSTSLPAV